MDIYKFIQSQNMDDLLYLKNTMSGLRVGLSHDTPLKLKDIIDEDKVKYNTPEDISTNFRLLAKKTLKIGKGVLPSYEDMICFFVMLLEKWKNINIPLLYVNISKMQNCIIDIFLSNNFISQPVSQQQLEVNKVCYDILKERMFEADDHERLFCACLLQIIYLRIKAKRLIVRSKIKYNDLNKDDKSNYYNFRNNSSEMPLLEISEINVPNVNGWKKLDNKNRISGLLSNVLNLIPDIISGIDVNKNKYMKVDIPDTARLAYSSKLNSEIGVICDKKTGKLFGGAKLSSGIIKKCISLNVILDFCGILFEQQQLIEINRQLLDIKCGIEEISSFQKEKRNSVITGIIRYYDQAYPQVLSSGIDSGVVETCEKNEVNLLGIENHIEENITKKISEIKKLKKSFFYNFHEDLKKLQEEIFKLCREFLLCLYARVNGLEILCTDLNKNILKEKRKNDIINSVNNLKKLLTEIDFILREKYTYLENSDRFNTLLKDRESTLQIIKYSNSIQEEADRMGENASNLRKSLSLCVKIENGKPTAISTPEISDI